MNKSLNVLLPGLIVASLSSSLAMQEIECWPRPMGGPSSSSTQNLRVWWMAANSQDLDDNRGANTRNAEYGKQMKRAEVFGTRYGVPELGFQNSIWGLPNYWRDRICSFFN